jgi:signal peptidase I
MKTAPVSLRTKLKRWWKKELRPLLVMATILFAVRSSLADWNDVPTGSMKPTILEGDRVYVNKLAYDLKVPFTTMHIAEWDNPHRGDIVVFYSPHDGQRLVKRVIGLPGDTIELRDNILLLNGETVTYGPIREELVRDITGADAERLHFAAEDLPDHPHAVATWPEVAAKRNFGPVTVPEGQYFMMGDNRDNSFDSRYFGPVERKRIVGRATKVVISLDREHHWKPRGDRFLSKLQ